MAVENSRQATRAARASSGSMHRSDPRPLRPAEIELPSRKARRVNSPGSARRAPASRQHAAATADHRAAWPCNSSTASPVYESGAVNTARGLHRSARRAHPGRRKLAWRGGGTRPRTFAAICAAWSPETRTTPIRRGRGVAIAAMGSRLTSPLGIGRFVAVEHAPGSATAGGWNGCVHQPVEHKAGGEEKEEDAEHIGMNFMTWACTGSGGTGSSGSAAPSCRHEQRRT